MRSISRRVAALEEAQGLGYPSRWHWIVGAPDETRADAQARYEREEEQVRDGEGVIFWRPFSASVA